MYVRTTLDDDNHGEAPTHRPFGETSAGGQHSTCTSTLRQVQYLVFTSDCRSAPATPPRPISILALPNPRPHDDALPMMMPVGSLTSCTLPPNCPSLCAELPVHACGSRPETPPTCTIPEDGSFQASEKADRCTGLRNPSTTSFEASATTKAARRSTSPRA